MATYRLPFDNSGGGWFVSNGNFDDPVSPGHGTSQAYAWDFVFDHNRDRQGAKGGRIYAARAGKVIDVRDGVDVVISNSDPSLGPGNYILVRHADDTISAYDHLKKNSIRVSVDQYVEQSTWLATVGNTGSTSGTIHLHFECHTHWTPKAIGDPAPLSAGPSLLVHFEDKGHTEWRPVTDDKLKTLPRQYRQDGWRFCGKCAALYFEYQGHAGVCPAGSTHSSSGGNYTLTDDQGASGQAKWKYCRKCNGLFHTGGGARCPVKTPNTSHDGSASNTYRLATKSSDPGQHSWRRCKHCQVLWFDEATNSVCPGNAGKAHSRQGNDNYALIVNPEDSQQGWRWCSRCQGLYFSPNGAGACAAGAGGHSTTGGQYFLYVDVSPINSTGTPQKSAPPGNAGWEKNWRYCNKCGLLWMGAKSGSSCPKGGGHSKTASGTYFLRVDGATTNSDVGQVGWRRCHKCQSIWMSLNTGSKCAAGGAHGTTGSARYVVPA